VIPPHELRRKLSPLLLGLEGVSGVGVPGGKLTVYLDRDDQKVRHNAASVVEEVAPGTEVTFVVTGTPEP
jgi:hypothetical protein